MGLLDDYQNQDTGENETEAAGDPDILRKKRAELERQIVITNSDLKKILREKENLEVERRKLKKEEERIRIERDALDKKINKLQNDQLLFEEEIKGFKKKLKVLA